MAAACILERYIEDEGEGSVAAVPCQDPPPEELLFLDYNLVRNHVIERRKAEQEKCNRNQKRDFSSGAKHMNFMKVCVFVVVVFVLSKLLFYFYLQMEF